MGCPGLPPTLLQRAIRAAVLLQADEEEGSAWDHIGTDRGEGSCYTWEIDRAMHATYLR